MRTRAFILCPSAGRDHRGFETGARNLFGRLKNHPEIEFFLAGSGLNKGERILRVRSLYRQSATASFLGWIFRRNSYVIQNVSFFLFLVPYLIRYRPSVLYLADPPLYGYLRRFRRWTGNRYRMVFHTGGNTIPLPTDPRDIFQCVTPFTVELARERNVLPDQIISLPHVVDVTLPHTGKAALKLQLGLPAGRLILLSVGALDTSVKRMDYVIREVTRLTAPFYLVMLGQFEAETPKIESLAHHSLPEDAYRIDCVSQERLSDYYGAADLFLLASLSEGFSRASVEALGHGLPILMHPFRNVIDIIGPFGSFTDMSKDGNLTRLIETYLPYQEDEAQKIARMEYVNKSYSWKSLEPSFLEMFRKAALPFTSTARE